MPGFSTKVPHPLEKQAAIEKLTGMMDAMREKYKDTASDVKSAWTGNVLDFSLKVMGFAVKGKITVEDKVATVEGQLPLAAAFFRGRIEESIKTEMEKELAA